MSNNTNTTVVLSDADRKAVKSSMDKAPSELHQNMKAWLEAAGATNVDLETVKLVCSLRHNFQRSEANQTHLESRRTAAQDKAAAQIAAAESRAKKAADKAAALKAKAAAPKATTTKKVAAAPAKPEAKPVAAPAAPKAAAATKAPRAPRKSPTRAQKVSANQNAANDAQQVLATV